MVIVMQPGASEERVQAVIERLVEKGFDVHRSTGVERTVLGAIGSKNGVDFRDFELLEGVQEVIRITEPYKLAGRTFQKENSQIKAGGVVIGGPEVVLMAGPCSVESRTQIKTIAKLVKEAGAKVLRGGAFKPRTSPYSFQGLGEEGLKYLREAADAFGLLTVSEIMDRMDIPIAIRYIDIIQIGARNMQNFTLLRELGNLNKPILLKRGMAATIDELLMAAEYVMSGGNRQVILCERGIRTFENATRNTLDISAIPVVKKKSHLPIIADPSHGTGLRDHVAPMARAAVAAGADGLLIEVHPEPDKALSDGAQSLYPEQFTGLVRELRIVAEAIGRKI
ncbi:MAG: 3-deoxy-7-phosphoheptulonate synthase [candidate division Zixibacteria bacterium]|nr:3-deoxy-7-phosphoheptulonate synthase [candidate division Zixibacteria bacterium]